MQEENLINSIIANIPSFVFWKDRNLVYQGCNNNFAAICGLKNPEEIVGKTDQNLPWSKFFYGMYKKEDLDILNKGISISNRVVPLLTAKGEERVVSVSKVPLYDANKDIIGVLGIFTDITEQKKAEEALQKENINKARLLRALGHDIRGKLSTVVGFSDLLLNLVKDPKGVEYIKFIQKASSDVVPILSRINHYLNLESGGMEIHEDTFNVRVLVHGFKENYKSLLKQHKAKLIYEIDDSIPTYLVGDYILIFEVMDNIIFNAIRFSEKTPVQVFLKEVEREEKLVIDFIVRDLGIGMSKAAQSHIFSLFELTESHQHLMPGFNLSISRKIAQRLGGDLTIFSHPGKGTELTFSFPVSIPPQKIPSARQADLSQYKAILEESTKSIPVKRNLPISVLVIEDDPDTQAMIREVLDQCFHCSLTAFGTLKGALEYLKARPALDLVLTDIALPDGEGYQVVQEINHLYDADHFPFVIAITAHAGEIETDEFFEKGVVDIIEKPFGIEVIKQVIVGLFGESVQKKASL